MKIYRNGLFFVLQVLDVVLKWSFWDDVDRKDNCLVLTSLSNYTYNVDDKVLPVTELKFADNKSKNFKSYMIEFAQAKINYYKDKLVSLSHICFIFINYILTKIKCILI